MKILYVCHRYWPFIGGSEGYFTEISQRFAKEGYDVTVYTSDAWDTTHFWMPYQRKIFKLEEIYQGVKIRRFRIRHLLFHQKLMRLLACLPGERNKILFGEPYILIPDLFKKLKERQNFDIIHATAIPYNPFLYFALKNSKKNKIPLIITPFIHTGEKKNSEILERFTQPFHLKLLKEADCVIVQTESEKETLIKKGIYEEKIRKVGLAIESNKIKGGNAESFRKKYNVYNKIVFQVSTLIYDKGTKHVLEAMKILWKRGYDITLVLVGYMEKLFEEYFLNQELSVYKKCVILNLTKPKNQNDIYDLFAAGDVMVMPSRADSFGVVFLEAWFYKKPVIGGFAGGIPEVISDGEDGYLVPFGNVHMLAEYIATLLDNKVLATQFGEKGYKKVLQKYLWQQKYEMIKKIYQETYRKCK